MNEILGDLIDAGEWKPADESGPPAELLTPVIRVEPAVRPGAITEFPDPARPHVVITCSGKGILPRIIGSTGSNTAAEFNVQRGDATLPRAIGELAHRDRTPGRRSREVLGLLQQGLSEEAIGAELDMKPGTVAYHLRSLRALGLLN